MFFPPGLQLIENFIDERTEKILIASVDQENWDTSLKRRTQHYGYKYSYLHSSATEKTANIPQWGHKIINRMIEQKYISVPPDQMIVNEYLPGQGIAAHIDHQKYFDDVIISLSLGSQCTMVFNKGQEYNFVLLPSRSLLIMSGEARYEWKHEIRKVKTDTIERKRIKRERRISLTFRYMIK